MSHLKNNNSLSYERIFPIILYPKLSKLMKGVMVNPSEMLTLEARKDVAKALNTYPCDGSEWLLRYGTKQ